MLTSHINQFGFVQKGGCNRALLAFTSTINYFVQKNLMFISTALMLQRHLTASIIFIYFSCLIDRAVSWCIVNTLHAWFRHMKACVK